MRKTRIKAITKFSCMLLVFIVLFTGCLSKNIKVESNSSNNLRVSYIDVGQGDSILVQQGNNSMLIDAGKNDASDVVVNYIKAQNINKLDYVIGTHPHEDHIGGLDKVINIFDIGKIYMPRVTSNTRTFRDVVVSAKNKGLKAEAPKAGCKFMLGNAECTILAPNKEEYEDLNNYSIVLKVRYGNKVFLFTGDAEQKSEKEIIQRGFDIKANILKLGHHGSHSSTSSEFLNRVNPDFAVISLGKNNDYGHPHRETLKKLNDKKVKILRTDQMGTIIIDTNGNDKLDISTTSNSNISREDNLGKADNNVSSKYEKQYVDSKGRGTIKGNVNRNGEKIYHVPGGKFYTKVKAEYWFKTISEAEDSGFRPSKR